MRLSYKDAIEAFVHSESYIRSSSAVSVADCGEFIGLFSYNALIAKKYPNKVVITNKRYSVTTTKHTNWVHYAALQACVPVMFEEL